MIRALIYSTLALTASLTAHAETDPWSETRLVTSTRSLGSVTLDVDPKTVSCYVDSTWEQGSVDFVTKRPLKGTDAKHTNWSLAVEGNGYCDTLSPPVEAELADGQITLDVEAKTQYFATYFSDGRCFFSIYEYVIGTHPTLGEFGDGQKVVELKLTTESCKQAFANWPKN